MCIRDSTGAGGEVVGNYCTWNPLYIDGTNNLPPTFSNGNLDVSHRTGDWNVAMGTIKQSSGKWYWEVTLTTGSRCMIGITKYTTFNSSNAFYYSPDVYVYFSSNGNKWNSNTQTAYGSSFAQGDVVGIALDLDAGTIVFYKNGVSQGTAFSSLSGNFAPVWGTDTTGNTHVANFGQRAFAYTAPSGFKALCTTNLPAPTIEDPSTVMDVALYSGNGSTQTISGLGFSPDLLWIKSRSAAYSHRLFDTIRGVSDALYPDLTEAEGAAQGTNENLTAFTSDGFSLGSTSGINAINNNNVTFAAWTWDGGTSTVNNNTDGSITPTGVRANASAGFSIVSYTGNNTTSTVGHGLNATPSLVIVKSRSAASLTGWMTKHSSLSSNYNLALNLTDAAWNPANNGWVGDLTSSTTFSLVNGSSNGNNVNQSGVTYVAYCFAPVEGYSAFGSYTGNGNADGPFVALSFRPAWIMIKCSSTNNNYTFWDINDSTRSDYNTQSNTLCADLSDSEDSSNIGTPSVDFLSNGFKIRTTGSAKNLSNQTYIYAAFAENPFKTARAR